MNAHVWTLLTKSLLDTKLISSCNSAISLSISLAWHRFKVSQAWSRLIISHFYHFGSWKKISQTIGILGVLQPIEIKYMGSHCTVPTPTRAPLCLRSFLTHTAFSITFTHSMLNWIIIPLFELWYIAQIKLNNVNCHAIGKDKYNVRARSVDLEGGEK